MFVYEFCNSFVAIGSVPLFVALNKMDKRLRKKGLQNLQYLQLASLLIIFAIGGSQILSIFGINIQSFMIAGGILLFILSIELLTHGGCRFGVGDSSEDTGVVPFTFPLLLGPEAITSVIISFKTTWFIGNHIIERYSYRCYLFDATIT